MLQKKLFFFGTAIFFGQAIIASRVQLARLAFMSDRCLAKAAGEVGIIGGVRLLSGNARELLMIDGVTQLGHGSTSTMVRQCALPNEREHMALLALGKLPYVAR